jgi:uncharacterized protein
MRRAGGTNDGHRFRAFGAAANLQIMPLVRCPICDRAFDPAQSLALPFCSDRCRQIDLGRWLREAYSVPVQRNPDDEEEPPETTAE